MMIRYAENGQFWFLNASWISLISPCCLRSEQICDSFGLWQTKPARLNFFKTYIPGTFVHWCYAVSRPYHTRLDSAKDNEKEMMPADIHA